MDAIQRMRTKAQGKGTLQSNQQQTVETQVVESKQVIVIEQANPQVVYVPSYDPTYVYGAPIYPYPPIAYPVYPTGGVIAAVLSYAAGRYLIEGNAFGDGYATTFLIAFVLCSLGITIVRFLVKEPEPPSLRPRTPLRIRMRGFRQLVSGDRN